MKCNLCGLAHRGWVSCAKARADADRCIATGTFNTEPLATAIEDDVVANAQKVANKHGVYADKEKRRAYMRELMRKRRGNAKD